MKLEKQAVNLELSKKLKELGVKQESLWWWVNWNNGEYLGKQHPHGPLGWQLEKNKHDDCECVSALTVAELGEMLRVLQQKWDLEKPNKSFDSYVKKFLQVRVF